MLQFPPRGCCCAHDQRAVRHRFCDTAELLRIGQQRGCADSGACFAKGRLIGINDAQMQKTEIAHGPRRSADIERIAGGDKDYTQMIEWISLGHKALSYRTHIVAGVVNGVLAWLGRRPLQRSPTYAPFTPGCAHLGNKRRVQTLRDRKVPIVDVIAAWYVGTKLLRRHLRGCVRESSSIKAQQHSNRP